MSAFSIKRLRIKAARLSSANKRAGVPAHNEITVNAPHTYGGHSRTKKIKHGHGLA